MLSCAALFVALGGSAYAAGGLILAGEIAPGAVTSKAIRNGAVEPSDLQQTDPSAGSTGWAGRPRREGRHGRCRSAGHGGRSPGASGVNGANGANGAQRARRRQRAERGQRHQWDQRHRRDRRDQRTQRSRRDQWDATGHEPGTGTRSTVSPAGPDGSPHGIAANIDRRTERPSGQLRRPGQDRALAHGRRRQCRMPA